MRPTVVHGLLRLRPRAVKLTGPHGRYRTFADQLGMYLRTICGANLFRLPGGFVSQKCEETPDRPPTSASSTRCWRRWGLYALQAALTGAIIWALWHAGKDALGELRQLGERGIPLRVSWGWCVAAGMCYAASLLPAAWFWGRVLRSAQQKTSFGKVLRAYLVGQIGKYVPGKACVVIVRTALVAGNSVQPAMAAASVFVETLTMMSVGAALATLYLVVWAPSDSRLLWTAITLAVVVTIPTLPPFFKPILRLLATRGNRPEVLTAIDRINFVQLWEGWAAMLLLWVGFGISLGLVLRAIELPGFEFAPSGSAILEAVPPLVASVALATVGGFLILFLPGGLGARELILAAVLAPYLASRWLVGQGVSGEVVALVAAVMLRLVWLATEIVLALVMWSLPYLAGGFRRMHPAIENSSSPPREVRATNDGHGW
ncbi:MAG: lysylphosphatidylglycerol synthase transmembrane domain-containing protein [Thermogutta sp.]